MKTKDFSEQELNILRDGLLALMGNTFKAFDLVKSEAAKKSINQEWTVYKALLDKLCAE